jgi:DNA-binding CsgD family transcriptional regulator
MIAMVGYVCFDIFIWVVLSELVYIHQKAPGAAIALLWLIRSVGIAVGMLSCQMLFSYGESPTVLFSATVSVGYLTVIAMTLLLGDGTGLWTIIKYGAFIRPPDTSSKKMTDAQAQLHKRMEDYGFTKRQKDVIELILSGRSASKMSAKLGISENTIISHVRHIYQITGVNSRQDLIDVLMDETAQPPPPD